MIICLFNMPACHDGAFCDMIYLCVFWIGIFLNILFIYMFIYLFVFSLSAEMNCDFYLLIVAWFMDK